MIDERMGNELYSLRYQEREEKDNKKICLFLCVLMVSLFVTNTGDILSEIMRGIVSRDTVSVLMKVLCAAFFINCIPVVLKHFTIEKMLISMISITVFAVNLVFNNPQLTDTAITYYSLCFTGFLAASSIVDYTMAKEYLLFGARVVGVLGILSLAMSFWGISSSLKTGGYNMGMGYSCIICIMLLFWNAVRNKAYADLIFAGGLLVLVFLYGSRGPLLGISLFVVYFGLKYFYLHKMYIRGILLTVFILSVLAFHEKILLALDIFLNAHGIMSRTAYLFAHSLNHDSGRNDIWITLWREIVNNPFHIRGINADYLIVGTYAHNLFIELMYQHGVILGSIVSMFVVLKVIKTLRLDVNSDRSIICLIFMLSSIPSLMFSGSLWTTQNFWIWLGIILRISHTPRLYAI